MLCSCFAARTAYPAVADARRLRDFRPDGGQARRDAPARVSETSVARQTAVDRTAINPCEYLR